MLKRTDERALLARAAPGATPGMKLVTRSWMVGQGEYTNGIESIKYVPQRTASVWMPFEQACDEESGDVDLDSFKKAPWDDGGTQRDERQEVMWRHYGSNIFKDSSQCQNDVRPDGGSELVYSCMHQDDQYISMLRCFHSSD